MQYAVTAGVMVASFAALAEVNLPKKQNLTAQERAEWYKVLHWEQQCEEDFREVPREDNFGGVSFWPLAPQKYLVEVNCLQGAYQGSYIYLYYNESAAKPEVKQLEFKTFEQNEQGKVQTTTTRELSQAFSEGNAEPGHFNPQTQNLTVETKYRGLGDCGHLAVYHINNDGTVVLQEFKAKFACDDKPLKYKTYFPKPTN